MKRLVALLVAVVGSLSVCSAAFADALTSGHSATNGPGGGQFTPPTGAQAGTVHLSGGGTLPFTGLNLATVAVVAVLLLLGGLMLRRMTRRPQ